MADSAVIRVYGDIRSGGTDYDIDLSFSVESGSRCFQQNMAINDDPSIILARCDDGELSDRGATLVSIDLFVIKNRGTEGAIITTIAPSGDLEGQTSISVELPAGRVYIGNNMRALGSPSSAVPEELILARYVYAQATTGKETELQVTAIGRGP